MLVAKVQPTNRPASKPTGHVSHHNPTNYKTTNKPSMNPQRETRTYEAVVQRSSRQGAGNRQRTESHAATLYKPLHMYQQTTCVQVFYQKHTSTGELHLLS